MKISSFVRSVLKLASIGAPFVYSIWQTVRTSSCMTVCLDLTSMQMLLCVSHSLNKFTFSLYQSAAAMFNICQVCGYASVVVFLNLKYGYTR
jgi:hypothetical protein